MDNSIRSSKIDRAEEGAREDAKAAKADRQSRREMRGSRGMLDPERLRRYFKATASRATREESPGSLSATSSGESSEVSVRKETPILPPPRRVASTPLLRVTTPAVEVEVEQEAAIEKERSESISGATPAISLVGPSPSPSLSAPAFTPSASAERKARKAARKGKHAQVAEPLDVRSERVAAPEPEPKPKTDNSVRSTFLYVQLPEVLRGERRPDSSGAPSVIEFMTALTGVIPQTGIKSAVVHNSNGTWRVEVDGADTARKAAGQTISFSHVDGKKIQASLVEFLAGPAKAFVCARTNGAADDVLFEAVSRELSKVSPGKQVRLWMGRAVVFGASVDPCVLVFEVTPDFKSLQCPLATGPARKGPFKLLFFPLKRGS